MCAGAGGTACGRCCHCAHARRASPLTCLAICFLVLTYNLLGGFLFLALEGAPASHAPTAEAASTPALSPPDARARTVERLWAITEDLNILYKENWTKLAARELLDFQTVLLKTLRGAPPRAAGGPAGVAGGAADHHYRWTFSTSFLYALTLITTIGHGNVTPQSAAGKLVALAYACVGIPLIMLYLATLGDALARRVRAVYWRLRPRARAKPPAAALERRTPFQAALNLDSIPLAPRVCGEQARVPALLSLALVAAYVALGAGLFHATERWSLVDGCYFAFSSLATIGFGDMRPGLRAAGAGAGGGGGAPSAAEDVAVGACCVYILVGIVVMAMCFNLVQEDLRAALRGVAGVCARGAVHSAHSAACAREKAVTAAS